MILANISQQRLHYCIKSPAKNLYKLIYSLYFFTEFILCKRRKSVSYIFTKYLQLISSIFTSFYSLLRAHEIIHEFHNRYFPKTSPWLAGLLAFFLLFLSQETKASPKFSIVWSTETHTGATNYLKDSSGQALDAGTAMNGDGFLVEIGYFSEGSFSSPFQENAFLGEWIPLTVNTRVGDSSSGYGFPDGMFTFKTTFTKDANFVTTFWGEPKYFTDYLEDDITANSPPPQTTPVCIRFYNSTNKLGSLFNTVSGPDWKWPSFPNGSSIPTTSYFKIAPGNAPPGFFLGTWVYF